MPFAFSLFLSEFNSHCFQLIDQNFYKIVFLSEVR